MQESLTNIARHSCANRIEIKLSRSENTINFSIADNGVGIPEVKLSSKKSFGLIGMNERAITLGGTFEINSESGKGTVISLNFPVQLVVSDQENEIN
jgi:signal transduction histidine kinase